MKSSLRTKAVQNARRAEAAKCYFCAPNFCMCLLSTGTRIFNKADLSEKTFSDTFFTKVSFGSCGIKRVRLMKEIQNESIRTTCHCQMFCIKYSTICLFVFLRLMFAEV